MDAQEFVVASDAGMLHELRTLNPGNRVIVAPTLGKGATCKRCVHFPWMVTNGLNDVARVLEGGEARAKSI